MYFIIRNICISLQMHFYIQIKSVYNGFNIHHSSNRIRHEFAKARRQEVKSGKKQETKIIL